MTKQLVPRKSALVTWLVILAMTTGCAASYRSSRIQFESQGERVSGVLNMPTDRVSDPTVLLVFVHGDGAMPADGFGYYPILWKRLADAGTATLSWDKKGVGGSQGDWLSQSMDDRAGEVVDALEHISTAYPDTFPIIGLIGWSQAGWVMPEVVHRSSIPDFMIVVSGAINWRHDGVYQTRQRLALEGATAEQVEAEVRRQARDEHLFDAGASHANYVATLRDRCTRGERVCTSPMSEALFGFAQRNRGVDATKRLEQVAIPTFAMFGDHDRNVDFRESIDIYRRAFAQGPAPRSTVKLYPGATHSLLKATDFDTVNPDWWWLVKLGWQQEDAFVDGVLDDIVGFASREAVR